MKPTNSAPYSGASLFNQPLTPAPAPQRPALLSRLVAALTRPLGPAAPKVTTEGGVAGSASPQFSAATRQKQTWDRRQMIQEIWQLYYTDPRFYSAVEKHVHKAAATGFRPKIEAREGTSSVQVRRATAEMEGVLRRTGLLDRGGAPNKMLLTKYLRHGRIEADLFLQHVIAWNPAGGGEIVKLKVMPSSAMERLSDDTDEFLDPARAFVQLDVNSQQVVPGGEFAAFQIGHHRWKQIGEDRYGSFEYGSVRDVALSLANLEKFQEVRRKSNAARIEEHIVGEPGSGGTNQKDLDEYGKSIGIRGEAAATTVDPYDQLSKVIHDGNTKMVVHPGDPSVHEVADLTYFLEKEGAALGTPLQLSGMNLAGMSRDTLDLIIAEWLDGMGYDVAWLYGIILEVICLQLELKGLAPDAFNITLDVPKRVFESATDAIAFVNKCMTNTLGAGLSAKPFPLLTAETTVEILAEYIGIANAEQYVQDLQAMMVETHTDPDTVHEMQQMGADPGVNVGAANSKNSAGGASTGHGERFENGKRTDGKSKPTGGGAYKKKA